MSTKTPADDHVRLLARLSPLNPRLGGQRWKEQWDQLSRGPHLWGQKTQGTGWLGGNDHPTPWNPATPRPEGQNAQFQLV